MPAVKPQSKANFRPPAQRLALENFSILTPVPPAADAAAKPAGEEAEDVKETYTHDTRWIIEAQTELRLLVHFTSAEVATHYANLTFEVVGAVGSGPVTIGVSGVAALPGISTEPRLIFPRCKKRRPEDGYAVKAFVLSQG
eukprot:s410_g14.t1